MGARLGAVRQRAQRKGEYGFVCPGKPGAVCTSAAEGKVRLWVNPDRDEFHCWHCGFGGRSLAPLMVYGSVELREYLESRPQTGSRRCAIVDVRPRCTALPEGYIPFRLNGSPAEAPYLTYLRRRGVSDEAVELYRMGYACDGQLRGRVVIPSFDAVGLVNFWCARSIDERDPFRYRLPVASKDLVSNEHMVDWTRPVYLVEGIFDEVAVGPQGIALYGKFMPPTLALRLVERRPPTVHVCLDDDAEEEAWGLVGRLMAYDLPCSIVRLPGKDPGTVGGTAVAAAAMGSMRVTGSASLLGARL